jgi:hypothetical protein
VSALLRRITLLALAATLTGGMLAMPVSAKKGPVASASKCKKAGKGKHKKKCKRGRQNGTTLPGQATHPTPTPPPGGGGTGGGGGGVTTPLVSAVGVTDNPVLAGSPTVGQVTISAPAASGGQAVALQSDTARAAVPSSVSVAAGQTTATFGITTTAGVPITATLTASIGASSLNAPLDIVQVPSVASVSLQKQCFTGLGSFPSNRVTLNVPAAADTAVALSSDNTSSLTVPDTVNIPSGSKSAFFGVNTLVPAPSPVTVTATLGGDVTDSASVLAAIPDPPPVSDLSLQPDTVAIGDSSTATVTLACEAPSNTQVTLTGSAGATVQPTVTVLAGALSATFPVSADGTGDYLITAANAGGSDQATLHVELQPD